MKTTIQVVVIAVLAVVLFPVVLLGAACACAWAAFQVGLAAPAKLLEL